MLVLDSGAVTLLASPRRQSALLIRDLKSESLWPPMIPSVVLSECLTGSASRDILVNRFLKICDVVEELELPLARRAGSLRAAARTGSAVDALVVAYAEPGGVVLTGDRKDLTALAAYAMSVSVISL